jgi:hypothetical protein
VGFLERALAEKDDISNSSKSNTANSESESMLNPIRPPGTEKGEDCAYDVDGNGMDL